MRRQVQDVGGIVERLLGFLETGRDFVTAEAIIQLKDLLRRYPTIAEASLSSVSNITPEVYSCASWRPRPLHDSPWKLCLLVLDTNEAATGRPAEGECMSVRLMFFQMISSQAELFLGGLHGR